MPILVRRNHGPDIQIVTKRPHSDCLLINPWKLWVQESFIVPIRRTVLRHSYFFYWTEFIHKDCAAYIQGITDQFVPARRAKRVPPCSHEIDRWVMSVHSELLLYFFYSYTTANDIPGRTDMRRTDRTTMCKQHDFVMRYWNDPNLWSESKSLNYVSDCENLA